ncbi:MAG: hypothetical protein QT11_C0001G0490 [archaeon GW2011_AR20]|nr:MAG: hypothetical protein QT11_C0001G0490 [archaeon GW2011_AR20]AQS28161.1 hypothetical protein [uncultured archaeon]MBS3160544.1 hypothetical protein [Candidatus Woesearchaeota archaeon]
MKKLLIIILILALLSPIIEGKLVNITKADFYIESRQAYRLEQGDGISFLKDNKEYVISVDEIGKSSVRLKSFGYKENGEKETFYSFVNELQSNKIDFERDNIYDMRVDLLEIEDNRTKVDLLFEALNEAKPQPNNETNANSKLKTGLIISISIVILGLLIYLILRKK